MPWLRRSQGGAERAGAADAVRARPGIFYFIILLPMKRRQQKVQEFLAALKVGDKVVTTGGIYGTITKLSDQSVQLQIADNVRIEVSRAPSSATRDRSPWSPEAASSSVMNKNLRWKVIMILAVLVIFARSASIRSSRRSTASRRPRG